MIITDIIPKQRAILGLALLASVIGISCTSTDSQRLPVYPVRGEVFYQGKPAEGAQVLLLPANDSDLQVPRPHGQVGQDGAFVLTTYRAGDGAPVVSMW